MIKIYQNVISNPDSYIEEILKGGFYDFSDGTNLFKNVCQRDEDEFYKFLFKNIPNYKVVLNFIRQSPLGQKEPNYIHTDDMMGDLTAVLYLNKKHPTGYGTTLYDDNDDETLICKAKYNSLFIFPSCVKHSRNTLQNFGKDDGARLVQVAFLSKK
mgnify:CR=1 FL=1|jgi:hypothetical protein|tara:strand:- start:92 stop:559 length:468 start_codon:yes stop_codon:yes gene_type:complete